MRARFAFIAIATSCLAFYAGTFTAAQQDDSNDADDALRELLVERRDTLAKRLNILRREHATGIYDLQHLVEAQDAYLLAELQLTTDAEKRAELHRERIDALSMLEKRALFKLNQGVGSPSARLIATAARLQAEIDLLREQQ